MRVHGGVSRLQMVAAAEEEEEPYDPRTAKPNNPKVFGPGFGPVAASRAVRPLGHSAALDAEGLAEAIRATDAALVTEGGLTFAPATVDGVALRLEPLAPSIGTVVHGADLSRCSEPMVAFLRRLLLERKIIAFRGQEKLTRAQHEAFAARFGRLGAMYGEDGVGDDFWAGKTPAPTHLGEDPPQASHGRHYLRASQAAPSAASNWHSGLRPPRPALPPLHHHHHHPCCAQMRPGHPSRPCSPLCCAMTPRPSAATRVSATCTRCTQRCRRRSSAGYAPSPACTRRETHTSLGIYPPVQAPLLVSPDQA